MNKTILYILFYFINFSKSFLVYFSNENNVYNDINYNRLFLKIDNIITLKDDFSNEDFYSILYLNNLKGFILPGGNSNFSNLNTNYWRYVNLVSQTDKPIIAICSGFEHYIKKITNNKLKFNKCDIKSTVVNSKIHNHKWCILNNNIEKSDKFKEFELTYFEFNNKIYLDKLKNRNIVGFSYHPEKALISENHDILESFTDDLKDIKEVLNII